MSGPLFVIADNYQLACNYAREHDLGREGPGWRYLRDWYQILGRSRGRFVHVTVGESVAAEHHDIVAHLRIRGWEEL